MTITFQDFLSGKVELNESKLFKGDKEIRTFDFNKKNMTEEEQLAFIEKKLKDYVKHIDDVNDEFVKIFRKYAKQHKAKFMHGGIKPLKSIMSKVVTRNKKFSELGDLIRGAMLFKTEEDLKDFISNLQRHGKVKILEIDKKEKVSKETIYYGVYHLDIEINDITIELQAMTERLWQFKGVAHKMYSQFRDSSEDNKFLTDYSRQLFDAGNKKVRIKEDINESNDDYDGQWFIVE